MIRQFDTVRLKYGLREAGIPPDSVATVVDVYEGPTPGYEIEIVDSNGRTLFLGSVTPDQIEPA
jgi:hypothetical protein